MITSKVNKEKERLSMIAAYLVYGIPKLSKF